MSTGTNILLLGSSGIPGRNILSSLLAQNERLTTKLNITVLKRSAATSNATEPDKPGYSVALIDDFSNTGVFAALLCKLEPRVIISALNAEPAPVLDNLVIDAVLEWRRHHLSHPSSSTPPAFINGYTLDLLHPSVSNLPSSSLTSLRLKIAFAERLRTLAPAGEIEYCTVVPASFLDYTLVKGYSAVDLRRRTATLVDGGITTITGCSLRFVGDVVALVALSFAGGKEVEKVRDCRLRVAETTYSGFEMMEVVQEITGNEFEVTNVKAEELLERGQIVRYLNWKGFGAADFEDDGFEFGDGILERRNLKEICRVAIAEGVEVFEGVGR